MKIPEISVEKESCSIEPLVGELLPIDCGLDGQDLPWLVYAISADDEPEDPFYIGITSNIVERAHAHNYSTGSSAYGYAKALEARGVECTMDVIAHYATKAEARAYESVMIALHPRLMNKDVLACTRALMRSASAPAARK